MLVGFLEIFGGLDIEKNIEEGRIMFRFAFELFISFV